MEGDEDQAERKAFLAKLKDYMEKRGTPIDRIPQLGQREVDLFKLYHEVTKRGGLNEVVSNKGMKEVAAAFHFPPTCTNAGFALRVHYLKYLFAYERRFFHNLDDDAMVPKRPVGRPRKEERMLRDEGKVREPIAPAYGPGTRRSTRRAASEAAARTSAAIAGERGITGPVGVSAASFASVASGSANAGGITTRSALTLRSAQDIMPQGTNYTRTAIPKANSRLQGAWASYHPALRLVALALESESTPSAQVDWALGTLLVLSFEEQLHLSAIPLTGLLDSLLRHARPYHSFLLRALGADDKNENESDDDSEDEESEESESESENDDGEGNGGVAPLVVPTKAERQRGVKVWEIVRNLSCIPENESALADHRRFVRTVVRLMNLERRLDQRQRRQRRRPTSVKREWVERLSRNALDVYSSVCHHPALAESATVARAAPALLYFIDSAGAGATSTSAAAAAAGEVDETVWTAVECLRKLTHEGDNEARLLPFTDALLDALAGLLCARDAGDDDEAGEGEGGGDDGRAKGEGGERRRRAGERESEVAELKGAVLAVLLNLAKCSPRTACRLPAHPGLMRRLFGLVATPSSSHNAEPGENENENENEDDGEADDEEEEGEEVEEEEEREEVDVEADDASATLKRKGEEEEEAVKAFLKSVVGEDEEQEDEDNDDDDNDDEEEEKRAAKRQKIDDAGGEKSEAAPTATSTSTTAGEAAPVVDGTAAEMEVEQETTKKNENGNGNESEAGSEKATVANGEEKNEEEKAAATAATVTSTAPAHHRVDGGGSKRKRRGEGDDGYAGDVVERVRERLRKQAGLVLSKLADDPACCDALRVYDGLVVQAMLLAPHQGPLAPLLHKLLLNIGLAATSSSPTAF